MALGSLGSASAWWWQWLCCSQGDIGQWMGTALQQCLSLVAKPDTQLGNGRHTKKTTTFSHNTLFYYHILPSFNAVENFITLKIRHLGKVAMLTQLDLAYECIFSTVYVFGIIAGYLKYLEWEPFPVKHYWYYTLCNKLQRMCLSQYER